MTEVLNQLFLEVMPPVISAISQLLVIVLLGIISFAANVLRNKFKIDLSEKTLSGIRTTLTDVVTQLNQQVVDDLKAKSADGKLTSEEKDEIIYQAKELALRLLDDKSLKFLREKYGDELDAIELLIESIIGTYKSIGYHTADSLVTIESETLAKVEG